MNEPHAGLSGLLVALSPLPFAAASWVHGAQALAEPSWVATVTGLTSLSLLAAGLSITRTPRAARLLARLGIAGFLAVVVKALAGSPAMALTALLIAGAGFFALSERDGGRARRHRFGQSPIVARARGAALVALASWFSAVIAGQEADTAVELASLGLSLLFGVIFAVYWMVREGKTHPVRLSLLLGSLLLAAGGIVSGGGDRIFSMEFAMLVPTAVLAVLPLREPHGIERIDWWEPVLGHPARLLTATFLILCTVGTLLLALPICSRSEQGVALADAAFTSVSAVCVTGLIVLDTPTDFTFAGHAVILLLIQLGGLGIMTFSTAAMRLMGRRMSLRHEGVVASLVSLEDRSQLYHATRRLLLFTFVAEAIGTSCLAVPFMLHGDGFLQALWRALFTSVSAFCNAGFALQSESLVPYQTDPWILHTVAALIIAGGLSPAVVLSLPHLIGRRGRPVPVQAKIVLAMTAILLVLGFLSILILEWTNTLGGLSFWNRIHNAWFQSVTLRTAGFNSIDIASVRPASFTIMLVWMLIGGSPGGTAGGIKTTTASIIVLLVVATVLGRWRIDVLGRTIAFRTVYRAVAITAVAVVVLFLSLLAVQLTQAMEAKAAIFEVVSALGTVGLSVGGTTQLDGVGKAIIMACMFVGRVGPLTLFMFMSHRLQPIAWSRPEEEIDVG